MSFSKTFAALLVAGSVFAQSAHAHVSFVANVPYAGKSYVATLNVPHGCEDSSAKLYDSSKIEVTIPAGFTGVRPSPSTFGKASVVKDAQGNVTKLVWTKAEADKLADDSQFYQITFRGTLPNAPFTALAFDTVQTCEGGLTQAWTGVNVPTLRVLPGRTVGWNKFTVPTALDLTGAGKNFFTDAAIVWKGKEGYSANSNTFDLIKKNATELKLIPANSDIWVKY